ncbi:protein kinase domain-containing protein [Streptomyces sp. NBC_00076]|uniref:serine/threonine-protein kinase n=1 Tax=Streptomyces sp. NBC_00076 TaxID=2975642 RepID=UPI003243739C
MLIAGRYRLQDPIGRGAMGEVWRGYDETLGRTVAVKLLLPHDSDPTATSRFRLEAQTAGRLNHPYVVGVYDFGEFDGRLFLVMELVEGDSLAGRLSKGGPLPAEQVARIATQAADGLAAAHQQGIVHRDIKPANLLQDAEGTLKIGDFGIARFVDDPSGALTTTGQIVGTSLYLAPERALGRPAGPACDVYALGCVLYQLLTGRPPFQADTAVAILHQHLDNAPVPPRQLGVLIPPAFENYLLGLLAKQPADRPTAQQVAEWFGGGAWQGRSEPLPEPAPTRMPTPGPRHTRTRTPTPAASPATGGPARGFRAETGPPTTYALPAATRRADRRPRRSRTGGLIAGAVVFLAAMVAGMLWFAPGRSTADTPADDTPDTTAPAVTPASTPSAAPATEAALPDASEPSATVPSPTASFPTAPSPTVPSPIASPEGGEKGEKQPPEPNTGKDKGGEEEAEDGTDED